MISALPDLRLRCAANLSLHKKQRRKEVITMNDKSCCSCPEGLAMATVPTQEWCEPYDWDKALEEGTIFSCLNLPFFRGEKDCSLPKPSASALNPEQNDREELMCKIASVSFAVNDLTLYLDTHPDCPNGTPLFYQLMQERSKLLSEFAKQYYPLTQCSMVNGELDESCFGWSEGPLPWEGGCI